MSKYIIELPETKHLCGNDSLTLFELESIIKKLPIAEKISSNDLIVIRSTSGQDFKAPIGFLIEFINSKINRKTDPRESMIYRLILNQHRELEKTVYSCKRLLNDIKTFKYTDQRKEELILEQVILIEEILKEQNAQIMRYRPNEDAT